MEKQSINYKVTPKNFETNFIRVDLIDFEDQIYSQVNMSADGAGALIINAQKELLMVHSVRPVVGEISWEIPRGGIDEGETSQEAAARELFEETGFSVSPEKLFSLGYINPDSGILNTRLHLFLHKTSVLPHSIQYSPDGREVRDIKWIGLDEVSQCIRKNIITDSITISALGKAKLMNLL